jgi:hypothetical protein
MQENMPVFEKFEPKIVVLPENYTIEQAKDWFVNAGYGIRRHDFNPEEECDSRKLEEGYPDFVATKNGEDSYIEFKSSMDTIKTNQVIWAINHPNKTYILAISKPKSYEESHKEQIKAYNKAYYEFHKEHYKAWRESRKEQIKARSKVYNESHKEQKKAWYESHKEQMKTYKKAYYQSHKEIRNAQNKAYRKSHKSKETLEDWINGNARKENVSEN